MKLRTRLVATVTAVITVASGLIGAFSVSTAYRNAMTEIDSGLREVLAAPQDEALFAKGALNFFADDVVVPVALGVVLNDGSIAVVRAAGPVYQPLPFPELTVVELGRAHDEPITVTSVEPSYRVLIGEGGPGVDLIAAAPLSVVQDQLNLLLGQTLLAVIFISIFAAALVWWVVSRNLAPVSAMVSTADAIADGDLGRRVPQTEPGSEIGVLASALNRMLGSLQQSVDQRAESESRMRRFLGDASHELRTPLTVIRGYAEILNSEADTSTEQRARAAARIDAESARMERLVLDLLNLAKLDEGSSFTPTEFNLVELTTAVAADFEVANHERSVQIVSPPEILITADKQQLTQVLLNALANVKQHTASGARITLIPSINEVKILIDDFGSGISAAEREKVFERFHRLDVSRTRETGGFGLGLSIMLAIVKAHGGSVKLSDAPTGGLRIEITLPVGVVNG
jgi:two-component system, OmpR family, sensor kinase